MVEATLAVDSDGTDKDGGLRSSLRIVPSPDGRVKARTPDPELKEMLNDIRRRHISLPEREGRLPGGDDAA